ncbi:MAG: serine/threonine-protein kinase, partial [Myxococcota bacterium]
MERPRLDPEALGALNALLGQALELAPSDRQAWVDGLASVDPELVARLRLLLDRVEEGSDALLDTLPRISAPRGISDAPKDSWSAGHEVGPYRLAELLGEGGMGSVWRAERTDGILDRPVALKLPHPFGNSSELTDRLAREREILASLSHPHIARLYDAGMTSGGQPYLALELIEGLPIVKFADAKGLAVRERVQLFVGVTRAVAYAHAQLVVHRDIKPSNILVGEDGRARLLDFGVAKLLEDRDQPDITQGRRPPFTLAYASPEQLRGETLGVATDIYSLGVVLYELLCGARPYRSEGPGGQALEYSILNSEPERPSQLVSSSSLKGDVDAIVLMALSKSPQDRYASAEAFGDDLERYLAGLPVRARPDHATYRLKKFVRRNRGSVLAAAVVLASIVAGATTALWQASVAVAEKQRAEAVQEFIASVFLDADPYGAEHGAVSATGLLHQAETRLEDRFRDRPELRAELQEIIGVSLLALEDYERAKALLARSYDEARRALGETHPKTLTLRISLASARRRVSETDGLARELEAISDALRRSPQAPPALWRQVLIIGTHLAIDEGRYAEAHAQAQAAHALSESIHGAETLPAVETASLRAVAYLFGASPAVGLASAQKAFLLAQKVLADAPRHPLHLDARASYARALIDQGRYAEGEPLLQGVVDDARAIFGPDCEMAGYFSGDLAEAASALGHFDKALVHAETTVRIIETLTGTASYASAAAWGRRGMVHLEARRPQAAVEELGRSQGLLGHILDSDHAKSRLARARLALALAQRGDHVEALETAAPLEVGLKAGTAEVQRLVGAAWRRVGRSQTAREALEEALERVEDGPRPEWERAYALVELGLVHLDLESFEEAEARLQEALQLLNRLVQRKTPEWAEVQAGLGRVALARGDLDAARGRLKDA